MIEWVNETFGIDSSVTVPTLISIIVFVTGGLVNYAYNRIREFNDRFRHRRTVRLTLNEIIKELKQKEDLLSTYYPKIKPEYRGAWSMPYKVITYLDIFLSFDYNQIYYSFRKLFFWKFWQNDQNKAFHKIYSVLRNLKYFESELKGHIEDFISKHEKHHDLYRNSIEEVRKYRDHIIRENADGEKDQSNQEYLNELNNIWYDWTKQDEQDRVHYQNTYENIVVPMLELNRDYYQIEYSTKFIDLLLACTYEYNEMENILKIYQDIFKSYYYMYRASKRIMKKCLEVIKLNI